MRCVAIALLGCLAICWTIVASASPHPGFDVYDDDGNAVVAKVYEPTDASLGGVEAGDVVLSVGGKSVSSAKQFDELLKAKKLGTKVRFKLLGGTTTKTIVLVLVDSEFVRQSDAEFRKAGAESTRKRLAGELKQTVEAAEAARKREEQINAEDPTLLPQLKRLLEEYELIADSDARWSEKASHCDRIADCYLKMRDKQNYQRWKLEAKAHRFHTPNTGGFGTRQ